MPRYVIERDLPGAGKLSPEDLKGISRRSCGVLDELGPKIQWQESFVTDDKIYCIYFSPDETLIKSHAQLTGLPVDRIEAVRRLVDPANYDSPTPTA